MPTMTTNNPLFAYPPLPGSQHGETSARGSTAGIPAHIPRDDDHNADYFEEMQRTDTGGNSNFNNRPGASHAPKFSMSMNPEGGLVNMSVGHLLKGGGGSLGRLSSNGNQKENRNPSSTNPTRSVPLHMMSMPTKNNTTNNTTNMVGKQSNSNQSGSYSMINSSLNRHLNTNINNSSSQSQ